MNDKFNHNCYSVVYKSLTKKTEPKFITGACFAYLRDEPNKSQKEFSFYYNLRIKKAATNICSIINEVMPIRVEEVEVDRCIVLKFTHDNTMNYDKKLFLLSFIRNLWMNSSAVNGPAYFKYWDNYKESNRKDKDPIAALYKVLDEFTTKNTWFGDHCNSRKKEYRGKYFNKEQFLAFPNSYSRSTMRNLNCYKIYHVFNCLNYSNWILNIPVSLEEANLILFPGGPDVNPERYGKSKHKTTYFDVEREKEFDRVYEYAIKNDIPMLGVCGGAQYLAVRNGAKMLQHVDNHTSNHYLQLLRRYRSIITTSTHHQMIDIRHLNKKDYNLLGVASKNLSSFYWEDAKTKLVNGDIEQEVEIIHFPKTRCLCVQGHPEIQSTANLTELRDYLLTQLNTL